MNRICSNCQISNSFSEESEKLICSSCGFEMPLENPTRILQTKPLSSSELNIGEELGRYTIERFLGRGGMGTVYEAHDPTLNRQVALKLLNSELAENESFVKRFDREAEHLARLCHDGVVQVLDRGIERNWPFLVMELVEGKTLRQEMNAQPMPLDRVLSLVTSLAETLKYSHQQSVVHRDIKPENILIDEKTQKPKLSDFGLSKSMEASLAETQITQTNILMGSLDYMAPEQRREKGVVTKQSDLYSLGVVFYEMLTATLPVGAFELPSETQKTAGWVDEVLKKLLASDPKNRYQNAEALLKDLKAGRVKEKNSLIEKKQGFNFINALQCLMLLLLFTAKLPFSWVLMTILLLQGIQDSRRDIEKKTKRWLSLSIGYWLLLLAVTFVFKPYNYHWHFLNEHYFTDHFYFALENLTYGQAISSTLLLGLIVISLVWKKKAKNESAKVAKEYSANLKKAQLPGLYRNSNEKFVAGVCSGFAHKCNMTTSGVRLITFIFFVVTLPLYLLAWILFPAYQIKKIETPALESDTQSGLGRLIAFTFVLALFLLALSFFVMTWLSPGSL